MQTQYAELADFFENGGKDPVCEKFRLLHTITKSVEQEK